VVVTSRRPTMKPLLARLSLTLTTLTSLVLIVGAGRKW
jgi:hypothetical protein